MDHGQRSVADLEHLDRSGLDSIRLPCYDHGLSEIQVIRTD